MLFVFLYFLLATSQISIHIRDGANPNNCLQQYEEDVVINESSSSPAYFSTGSTLDSYWGPDARRVCLFENKVNVVSGSDGSSYFYTIDIQLLDFNASSVQLDVEDDKTFVGYSMSLELAGGKRITTLPYSYKLHKGVQNFTFGAKLKFTIDLKGYLPLNTLKLSPVNVYLAPVTGSLNLATAATDVWPYLQFNESLSVTLDAGEIYRMPFIASKGDRVTVEFKGVEGRAYVSVAAEIDANNVVAAVVRNETSSFNDYILMKPTPLYENSVNVSLIDALVARSGSFDIIVDNSAGKHPLKASYVVKHLKSQFTYHTKMKYTLATDPCDTMESRYSCDKCTNQPGKECGFCSSLMGSRCISISNGYGVYSQQLLPQEYQCSSIRSTCSTPSPPTPMPSIPSQQGTSDHNGSVVNWLVIVALVALTIGVVVGCGGGFVLGKRNKTQAYHRLESVAESLN